MKSKFLFFVFALLSINLLAQDPSINEKPKFMDRLVFGGGLGVQFGTITFIDVSPVVGYRLTEKLEAGVGATYKYYRYKDFYIDQTNGEKFDLKSHMFGGSVYTRYHILKNIFAHVEYERLRYNYEDISNYGGQVIRDPKHTYINSLFVGGGLKQQITKGSYMFIMALWNLTEEPMTPYSNPVIRMGVLLGR